MKPVKLQATFTGDQYQEVWAAIKQIEDALAFLTQSLGRMTDKRKVV